METKKLMGDVCLDVVYKPIDRNLTDAEVLELYHSGRGMLVESDADEEVMTLMNMAIKRTLRCQISKIKSEDDVRTYYKILFGGESGHECAEMMRNKAKCKQFVCEHVGVLVGMGVIVGSPRKIAERLGFKTVQIETVMRYVRRGKKFFNNF